MDKLSRIRKAAEETRLDYCHYTLARFIANSIPGADELCLWLSVLVNIEINRGNVCLEIASIRASCQELGLTGIPTANELLQHIRLSPVVGNSSENRPLIVDHQRLYLNRYFHNEKNISDSLLAMTKMKSAIAESDLARLDRLFAASAEPDYQKLAAVISCMHPLCIISGGPGTGKTWTVSKILALLLQQNPGIHIKLAAPTGKAAARLSESIQQLRDKLDIADALKHLIPLEAVTLHRLLVLHRYTHRPRYHKNNPLPCDVLVLDEASMIDQQMMAAICAAIKPECRLILLGDKDQLSSVEAGSVFADLCGDLQQTEFSIQQQKRLQALVGYPLALHQGRYTLADHVVVLQKSHRFDEYSGIGQLARSINQGDTENSLLLLKQAGQGSALSWQRPAQNQLPDKLRQQAATVYLAMMQAESIGQAFGLFHQYQILSAVWSGPTGVDTINSIIEAYLKARQGLDAHCEYYAGKPLMMTSNVYQYDIHNGDIGILWPDQQGQLKIWFEVGAGEYRLLSLSQLPRHKTAYAMTVHKSQGSEFNHVLLILPSTESPVSTRELLYTGITRAVKSVEIWGSESTIKFTIQQKTRRVSGLMDRLQQIPQSIS